MVSVCMATYNGEAYIKAQLTSILQQLEGDDEIVVCDDCSSDHTTDIIEGIGDNRIRLVRNDSKLGVNKNFEKALLLSKGDYIFFSDQDNIWQPDKVEKCKRELLKHDCVLHDCCVTDMDLNPVSPSLFTRLNAKPSFFHNLLHNCFSGCCMAVKRTAFHHILPFPDDFIYFYDQWIGMRLQLKGKVGFLREPLLLMRRHSHVTSTTGMASRLSFKDKFIYRVILLKDLFFTNSTNR